MKTPANRDDEDTIVANLAESVDLPVETFIVEANVNILTSLLFLKKEAGRGRQARGDRRTGGLPDLHGRGRKVGFDRRGNTLYKRSPEGEEITEVQERPESVTRNGRTVTRTLRRREKIVDNDLPGSRSATAPSGGSTRSPARERRQRGGAVGEGRRWLERSRTARSMLR